MSLCYEWTIVLAMINLIWILQDIVEENYQYEPALDICLARIVGGSVVPIEMIPYQVQYTF